LLYSFFFYLSSDTPLQKASLFDVVWLLGLIVSISFCGAALLNLCISIVRRFSGDDDSIERRLERSLICIVLFTGFALLVENWAYSVFGFGLKSGESWWPKFLFAGISIFLAYQFSPFFCWLGKAIAGRRSGVFPLLVLTTIGFLVFSILKGIGPENIDEPIGEIQNKYNVLILISDGVNASEVSLYGGEFDTTPFLHSIKSESMVFENAYTNNQNSTGSIVSLLTGMSPLTTRVVYPPDILRGPNSRRSLPRILGELGYYRALWGVPHYVDADSQNMIGAFDSNNKIGKVRPNEVEVLDKSFFRELNRYVEFPSIQLWYLRNIWKAHRGVLADMFFIKELDNPYAQVAEDDTDKPSQPPISLTDRQRVINLFADIEESAESKTPFFILTHLMSTHGHKFRPNHRVFSMGLEQTERRMVEFYRDSILDFDSIVNQVYNKLKETNQLENTIFIVGSDHGAAWNNKKRVPLLVRLPNSSVTGNYNVNVQLVDIAPTVLNAVGLTKPSWMEGDSLMDPENIKPNRFIISAGVFGNRLLRGVWVRKDPDASQFANGNKFSAVYCDFFMKSAFPLDFTPKKLPDRIGASGCITESLPNIAEAAEQLLNTKLVN